MTPTLRRLLTLLALATFLLVAVWWALPDDVPSVSPDASAVLALPARGNVPSEAPRPLASAPSQAPVPPRVQRFRWTMAPGPDTPPSELVWCDEVVALSPDGDGEVWVKASPEPCELELRWQLWEGHEEREGVPWHEVDGEVVAVLPRRGWKESESEIRQYLERVELLLTNSKDDKEYYRAYVVLEGFMVSQYGEEAGAVAFERHLARFEERFGRPMPLEPPP